MVIELPQRRPKVLVIAPSSDGVGLAKSSIVRASCVLGSVGLDVELDEALDWSKQPGGQSGETRARRLLAAFEDTQVAAIFAVYGGYNSLDLLPFLDFEFIRRHRKPIVGFSDITVLLAALYSQGITGCFHGPNFASLGEPDQVAWTANSLQKALFEESVILTDPGIVADDPWFLHIGEPRNWRKNAWKAARHGVATGELLGGNLPSLLALAGTRFFPNLTGCILMLEANSGTPVREFDRGLRQLSVMGVLPLVKGLVIGVGDKEFEAEVAEMIERYRVEISGPIMYGVNCSHGDPVATLPYGHPVTIDAECGRIFFVHRPPLVRMNSP